MNFFFRLYDIYQSYYGGMNCVAWSPDGRYILASIALLFFLKKKNRKQR